MIRSNIGNVGVNGLQTLSVIGTTAAGMARANEAQKLNNVMSGRKYLSHKDMEMIGKSRAEAQKNAALEIANKEVKQKDIDVMKDIPEAQVKQTENKETKIIRVDSPQGEQLSNYIENNVNAYEFLVNNSENENEEIFIKDLEEDR